MPVRAGKIITLTTDFGYRDAFVGSMKGVILSINPSVAIVDITHDVEPYNVEEGAYIIGAGYLSFPLGTIHIAVVDPGVGSERRAIIVEADGHYLVGPDNGIFSYVMSLSKGLRIVHMTGDKFILAKDSPTFQGRDVFAPAAAWLSRGVNAEEFGPVIHDAHRLSIPLPIVEPSGVSGEVIHIDRFGNAITNIKTSDVSPFNGKFYAEIRGKTILPLMVYDQAADTGLHCLMNSNGHLEFFVNRGNASRMFGIKKGDATRVSFLR